MNKTILAVDDEQKLLDVIRLFLSSEGYHVVTASTGAEALAAFAECKPDLVILDVLLPDMSGFEVCSAMRKQSDVLILFLSAMGDDDYQIAGYRAGGDDYIAKPFKASVLTLKIRRMLERNSERDAKRFTVGGIVLDESSFTCTVNGEEVALTKKEFQTLLELMRERGRVLTRDYLLRAVWGYDYAGESRSVDTLVTKLRKKLGSEARLIKTVVNVGYKME